MTVMCSWPNGGEPRFPFPYSDEVWTGCEYHVAAHLFATGQPEDALRIVAPAGGEPAPAPDLERKEQILLRLAELLAPRADEALRSFAEHVVSVSRARRTR